MSASWRVNKVSQLMVSVLSTLPSVDSLNKEVSFMALSTIHLSASQEGSLNLFSQQRLPVAQQLRKVPVGAVPQRPSQARFPWPSRSATTRAAKKKSSVGRLFAEEIAWQHEQNVAMPFCATARSY